MNGQHWQTADIYTEGFIVLAVRDRLLRLANHLDAQRFWGGHVSYKPRSGQLRSERKAGVQFTYWTANPWQGRESLQISGPAREVEGT